MPQPSTTAPRLTRLTRSRLALALGLGLALAGLAGGPGAAASVGTAAAPLPAKVDPRVPGWWSPAASQRDPLGSAPSAAATVRVDPDRAYAFGVDLRGARTALAATDASIGDVVVLPDPAGTPVEFRVAPTEVLAPVLAARHPEIATYSGRGVLDPGQTVRVDVTPLGLHASVRDLGAGTSWYVDPSYDVRGAERHLSYRADDLPEDSGAFVERGPLGVAEAEAVTGAVPRTAAGAEVQRRTYRLALVNDPSYAAFFGSANVLAEKATLMQRVDQIYLDDLGITMRLIGATDTLNLDTTAKATGRNGPCGAAPCYTAGDLAACQSSTLTATQSAVDRAVGPGAYDIGHLVLGTNGGGVATIGVVGRGGLKARGCTGLSAPIGDGFYVDYVAHEMGHQFGGLHTFDGDLGACGGGNRTGSSAVEPGSGSSVMAYAGICGGDDLQPHTDPYFSQRTITEITRYVASRPEAGGTLSASGNHAPSVRAPADKRIPVRTPFTVRARASDIDGDTLSYLWEENDNGGRSATRLRSSSKTHGPLFRVFADNAEVGPAESQQSPSPGENQADGSSSRTFPDLAQVLAGHTNAATGTCGARSFSADARLDCFSEFLPTRAWAATGAPLDLRVTVRDGAATGGVQHDDVALRVDGSAGPLQVTSQSSSITVAGGRSGVVRWAVNHTAKKALAPQVRILLSTDGGDTWGTVLKGRTRNDGRQQVTWPSTSTGSARIEVQAVGNYFFAVNDAPFTIG